VFEVTKNGYIDGNSCCFHHVNFKIPCHDK
jgi:hypothetical protein